MKTIQIGDIFGDVREVRVDDNETVESAAKKVGFVIAGNQSVLLQRNATEIDSGELPSDGETYFITSNHTSGNSQ